MLLAKIGIFRITFGNIYTFIFGIAIGIAIMTIIYLLYVLKQMNSKKFKNMSKVNLDEFNSTDLEKEKVANTIKEYCLIFNDKKLRKGYTSVEYTKYLTWSLIKNIAEIYYPKSKRPYLDITISDASKLLKYASKRLDQLLDFNGLRIVRKININTALGTVNIYKKVNDTNFVKFIYKFRINKILFGFKVLINLINPIYWVRKLIVNKSFKIISDKICVNVIQIAGEEAYNIYSKSVFSEGAWQLEN